MFFAGIGVEDEGATRHSMVWSIPFLLINCLIFGSICGEGADGWSEKDLSVLQESGGLNKLKRELRIGILFHWIKMDKWKYERETLDKIKCTFV